MIVSLYSLTVSTLTEDMRALLRGENAAEYQDIELVLNGRIIKAHKVNFISFQIKYQCLILHDVLWSMQASGDYQTANGN